MKKQHKFSVLLIVVAAVLALGVIFLTKDAGPKITKDGMEQKAARLIKKSKAQNELKEILFLNEIFSNYQSASLKQKTYTSKFPLDPSEIAVIKGTHARQKDTFQIYGDDIILCSLEKGDLIAKNHFDLMEMQILANQDIQIDTYVIQKKDISLEELKEMANNSNLSKHGKFVFQTFDYKRSEFENISINIAQKFLFEKRFAQGIVLKISNPEGKAIDLKIKDIYLMSRQNKIIENFPSTGYFTWGYKTLKSVYLPTGCVIKYRIYTDKKIYFDGYLGAFLHSNISYRIKANKHTLLEQAIPHSLEYFIHEIEPQNGRIDLEIQVDGKEDEIGVLGNFCFFQDIKRGNIVLHLIDALRSDNGGIKQKLFENYFADGAIFSNAYANAIQTADSLPVIFSGKYKFMFVESHADTPYVQDNEFLLTEYLKTKGFVTAAFIGNPWLIKSNSLQGFDYVEYCWKQVKDHTPFISEDAYTKIKYGDLETSLSDFIEKNRKKPLFIYMHTMETHRPYELPVEKRNYSKDLDREISEQIYNKFSRPATFPNLEHSDEKFVAGLKALYKDSVLSAYAFFEKIYTYLQQQDIINDSSLFILTSDHGERLFEHKSWHHGPPDIYNEVARIPLMIKGKTIESGIYSNNAQLADIYPTIIDWCEESPPADLVGDSLLELMSLSPEDKYFQDRPIYIDGTGWKLQYAYIQNNHKAIFDGDKISIYDLFHDPFERNNLYPDNRFKSFIEAAGTYRTGFEINYSRRKKEMTDEEIQRLKSLGYIK